MIEPGTSRLPVFSTEKAQPLVGPKMDNVTSMLYPGFEPGTFGGAAGSPNLYTAWSAQNRDFEVVFLNSATFLNIFWVHMCDFILTLLCKSITLFRKVKNSFNSILENYIS